MNTAPRLQRLSSTNDPKILPAGNLVELFEIRTGERPEKMIYSFLEDGLNVTSSITYREMNKRAKSVAAYLQKHFKKGDRALMLFPSGIEFIVSLVGCFYSGIIAVPAYPPKKNKLFDRFEAIAKDCGPAVILTTEKIRNDLEKNHAGEEVLKNIRYAVYEDILEEGASKWEGPDVTSSDIAMLQYTSGSTGRPNGVILTHKNILYNSEFIKQAFGHDENLVGVNWLPGFHDMGLIGALLQPLYVGGCNYIIPPSVFLMRPQNWLKAIGKYKAITAGGPNFAYEYCVDRVKDEELEEIDLSTVDPLFSGAEPVRKHTIEKFTEKFKKAGFSGKQFYPCYGMAESVLIITGGDLNEPPMYFHAEVAGLLNRVVAETENEDGAATFVGCGRPMAGTDIAIVDTRNLDVAEKGIVGEIWVKGPSVAPGYWGQPGKTEETFNAFLPDGSGPWLRTGDLGFIEKGQLFITGRMKDLIIIRGRNYHPTDIELGVEEAHESINKGSVAAFSVETENGEQLAVAAEIKRPYLRELDGEEVFTAIRSAVASGFQVEVFAIELLRTNSLPKTSSGKIQRFECRSRYVEGTLQSVASWKQPEKEKTPLDRDEELIIAWMKEWIANKLDIDKESLDETVPVDKLGLDSVMAVVMAQDAGEEFGIEWPLDLFLEETTLERIAKKGKELL